MSIEILRYFSRMTIKTTLLLILFLSLIFSCSEDSNEPIVNLDHEKYCPIQSYVYQGTSFIPQMRLSYIYDIGLEAHKVYLEKYSNSTWERFDDYFEFTNYPDSTIIYYYGTTSRYYKIIYNEDRIREINRYYASTGGIYNYTFDYSIPQTVSVILNYSNRQYRNDSMTTSIYHFDGNDNVNEVEIYKNPDFFDSSDYDHFEYRKIIYEYDNSPNPLTGYIMPFFFPSPPISPDVRLFTKNNPISSEYDGQIKKTNYTYNDDAYPTSISYVLSNGQTESKQIEYFDCNQ
ncbi:MAG: hypothetical protein RIB54_02555 [Fulvivirga sp.]